MSKDLNDKYIGYAKTSSLIPESFIGCEAPTSPNLSQPLLLQHSRNTRKTRIFESPTFHGELFLLPWILLGMAELPDPETSRLLYDDPYRAQYGSNIQSIQRPVYQPDPESVKREREALDGICHAMSDNLIDVFTIQPQPASPELSDRSRSLAPHANGSANGDLASDHVRLNTIRRGRGGRVLSTTGKSAVVSKAVQEAIG
ncbi:hypothetical protein MMC30_002451 [Trapelia coarctata]|nr:hypothetical protein [Trapelia coarctata]